MAKKPKTGQGIKPKTAQAKAFEAAVRKAIVNPIIGSIQGNVDQALVHYQSYKAAIDAVRNTPIPGGLTPDQEDILRQWLKKQEDQHKAEFHRKMRQYLGVRAEFISDADIGPIMQTALENNVSLIKTILPKYHQSLVSDLSNLADIEPFNQQAVRTVLAKNYSSAGYNLRRITRDQTNKLIGNLNQARQTQAGITKYMWQTSNDERVRDSHWSKDGQIFSWDLPPSDTGHPGHDIQCRCSALPIIDEDVREAAAAEPFVSQPGPGGAFKSFANPNWTPPAPAAAPDPAVQVIAPASAPGLTADDYSEELAEMGVAGIKKSDVMSMAKQGYEIHEVDFSLVTSSPLIEFVDSIDAPDQLNLLKFNGEFSFESASKTIGDIFDSEAAKAWIIAGGEVDIKDIEAIVSQGGRIPVHPGMLDALREAGAISDSTFKIISAAKAAAAEMAENIPGMTVSSVSADVLENVYTDTLIKQMVEIGNKDMPSMLGLMEQALNANEDYSLAQRQLAAKAWLAAGGEMDMADIVKLIDAGENIPIGSKMMNAMNEFMLPNSAGFMEKEIMIKQYYNLNPNEGFKKQLESMMHITGWEPAGPEYMEKIGQLSADQLLTIKESFPHNIAAKFSVHSKVFDPDFIADLHDKGILAHEIVTQGKIGEEILLSAKATKLDLPLPPGMKKAIDDALESTDPHKYGSLFTAAMEKQITTETILLQGNPNLKEELSTFADFAKKHDIYDEFVWSQANVTIGEIKVMKEKGWLITAPNAMDDVDPLLLEHIVATKSDDLVKLKAIDPSSDQYDAAFVEWLKSNNIYDDYVVSGGELKNWQYIPLEKMDYDIKFIHPDALDIITNPPYEMDMLKTYASTKQPVVPGANPEMIQKIIESDVGAKLHSINPVSGTYDPEFALELQKLGIYDEYVLTLGEIDTADILQMVKDGENLPIPDVIGRIIASKRLSMTEGPPSAAFARGWKRPRGEIDLKGIPTGQARDMAPDSGRISAAKGSNPGGIFQGSDGVNRYVKFYKDTDQAYAEAVANRIYRDLGLNAPKSTLVYNDEGLVGIANEMIESRAWRASADNADEAAEVLRGFVPDVWLGNWDAVGTGSDNVVVAAKEMARIDQGGTLQFRAMGARKTTEQIADITEWDGFTNPAINPYYQEVFEAAGLDSANDLGSAAISQWDEIAALRDRTNNFADLVPHAPGVSKQTRNETLIILRTRAKKLEEQYIAPLRASREAGEMVFYTPEMEQHVRKIGISDNVVTNNVRHFDESVDSYGSFEATLKDTLTDIEKAVIVDYSSSGYRTVNDALRTARMGRAVNHFDAEYADAYSRILNAALNKMPASREWVYRGVEMDAKQIVSAFGKLEVGGTFTDSAFTSTSTTNPFKGPGVNVRMRIWSETGRDISFVSMHPDESEVLMAARTKYRILDKQWRSNEYGEETLYIVAKEIVAGVDPDFDPLEDDLFGIPEELYKFWSTTHAKEQGFDAMDADDNIDMATPPDDLTPAQLRRQTQAWIEEDQRMQAKAEPPRHDGVGSLYDKMLSSSGVATAEAERRIAKERKIAEIGAAGVPKNLDP